MNISSTRTVAVLALLLHGFLAFGQTPDCPKQLFFKTLGTETQTEFGTALIASADTGLYMAGRVGLRTFLRKMTAAGEPIWTRDFQVSPFEAVTPIQIIEDSEGMIVGCGTQAQFAGATRGFVFRYNPLTNTLLWAHPVVGNNPTAAGILEKSAGGSFVYYQNPTLIGGETDIEILDLDRGTGNIIPAFASRYEHISYDALSKMAVSADGSLYGLGWAAGRHGTTTQARRALLARFDPVNGMPIWAKLSHLDTSAQADMYGRDLLVDGDALVAAYVSDEDLNVSGPSFVYLQKTDLDGNVLWLKRYDVVTTILRVISVSDGYVVSGQQNGGEDYFAFKVDKNGDFIWGKTLQHGPTGLGGLNSLGPDQSTSIADSLYFTGFATSGLGDVFFWKMLNDGTTNDSCSLITDLVLADVDVNAEVTDITLNQLLSTTITTNVTPNLTDIDLVENLICPDCTVPDPCPEDNDFSVEIGGIDCVGGQIQMSVSYCDFNGDPLPDGLNITLYDGNPFTGPADKLTTITHAGPQFNCTSVLLVDLESLFGLAALQNGVQIFAVANDPGDANTPYSLNDFPLSDLAECDYTNNMDSLTVQLPAVPTLNLGTDQIICANQSVLLNAGPGFFKYQWSNGISTQTNSISNAGQYRVTVTDACGFQQVDTVGVQVRQLPLVQESGEFCPGKSVTVRGFVFDQIGTFQRTIPGVNGDCDTSATFFIDELPYEERIEVFTICPFETVTINGVVYEDSGLVRDTVPSATTCDTIVFYFINQLPLPFRNTHFDICPGDSVVFNGNVYYQSTGFTDTLYSTGFGCDTVVYVSISVLPGVNASDTIQFCPGTSVEINGQTYTQPGEVVVNIPSSTGGCDTLLTYTLQWQPGPTQDQTVQFCPGTSVDIGGQTYTQPGTVFLTIPGTGGGCDTLVTYTLEWLPSPTRAETLAFCPGTSVEIDGQTYTQPGTVTQNVPDILGGCDTVVTYTLSFSPLPTRSETVEFCAGESLVFNGQTYTQPATVTLTLPGANNDCDTIVTYSLQFLSPPPSTLTLNCPSTVTVATTPGTGATAVNYANPTASSDCVCPGIDISLSSGLASGSLFPVGNTQVCFAAQDSCGSVDNCCFLVTVREELPCDTKTNGCIQYDLLGITANSAQQRTYRIRVTNTCANKLIYTAIQIPDGVTAVSPNNLSTYTSPDGRNYTVRNPNYSPFYSIRFKSTTDSIANGQSDVFEYTLPAQSQPTFINITTRLATQNFYPAHLNTFNCPIGITPSSNREETETFLLELPAAGLLLFPNPTSGELFADLSRWQGQDLNIQVLDSRGARVQFLSMTAASDAQAIPLSGQLASGMYFLEILTTAGDREVARFLLER